jgi:molecular chaperone DnaK (HSP70)
MANEIINSKYGHSISYDAGPDCEQLSGMHLTGGKPVVHNNIKCVRFETKYKDQTIQIKYESRPELAALVVEYEAIMSVLKTERDAKWAADKAIKDVADQPLLDAMHAHVAELMAQIPVDHVQLTVKQTGDMDGDPILEYTADGVKLGWQDITMIGVASAIRPGAWGAFASIRVASISRARLEEIRAEQQTKSAAAQATKDTRKKELAETAIPASAVEAYNYYHGDADKAWENEDESAWAAINKWSPYIETQRGMDPAKLQREIWEMNREANYGINEG